MDAIAGGDSEAASVQHRVGRSRNWNERSCAWMSARCVRSRVGVIGSAATSTCPSASGRRSESSSGLTCRQLITASARIVKLVVSLPSAPAAAAARRVRRRVRPAVVSPATNSEAIAGEARRSIQVRGMAASRTRQAVHAPRVRDEPFERFVLGVVAPGPPAPAGCDVRSSARPDRVSAGAALPSIVHDLRKYTRPPPHRQATTTSSSDSCSARAGADRAPPSPAARSKIAGERVEAAGQHQSFQ